MKRRPRIYYSAEQRALIWERWRKGETLHQIAHLFDRYHSSIRGILAETVVNALIKHAHKLPQELYQSLTWDRGSEMADHQRFTLATDIKVYFCDPQSPWQRGSNEIPMTC